jgi:hypothetical protein
LAALGVDDAGSRDPRRARAYNRANPENMLSVLCLLRLLDGAQAVVGARKRARGSRRTHPVPSRR